MVASNKRRSVTAPQRKLTVTTSLKLCREHYSVDIGLPLWTWSIDTNIRMYSWITGVCWEYSTAIVYMLKKLPGCCIYFWNDVRQKVRKWGNRYLHITFKKPSLGCIQQIHLPYMTILDVTLALRYYNALWDFKPQNVVVSSLFFFYLDNLLTRYG